MPSARTAFGSSATAANRAPSSAGNGAPVNCSERLMMPMLVTGIRPGHDRHVAAGGHHPVTQPQVAVERRRTSG